MCAAAAGTWVAVLCSRPAARSYMKWIGNPARVAFFWYGESNLEKLGSFGRAGCEQQNRSISRASTHSRQSPPSAELKNNPQREEPDQCGPLSCLLLATLENHENCIFLKKEMLFSELNFLCRFSLYEKRKAIVKSYTSLCKLAQTWN